MATYFEWNEVLFEALFEPEKERAPVYLSVDDDVLGEIADDQNIRLDCSDASEDLAAAVRSLCAREGNLDLGSLSLSSPEETPPQLAFLALCVLAASRMEPSVDESTIIASTNYYARLGELLDLTAGWSPNSFENRWIEVLWLELKARLLIQDRGDLQLTEGPRKRRFVWYPISQCLLSRHDRNKLKSFFKSEAFPLYCDPLTLVPKFEEKLLSWIARSNISARVKSIATSTADRKEELKERVRRELACWNGEDEQKHSAHQYRSSSPIQLKIEITETGETFLSALFKKRASYEGSIEVKENALAVESLTSDPSSGHYDPISLPESYQLGTAIQILAQGKNRVYRFELAQRDVYVFRRDPRFFGALVSTDRLILGEESAVACSAALMPKVLGAIKDASGLSNAEISERHRNFGQGWSLFTGITPTRLITVQDERLAGLAISSSKGVSLVGGVSLHGLGRRRVYLVGYPPAVELHGSWREEETINLDGQDLIVTSRKFNLPQISSGTHRISYGDNQSLNFEVISATPKNEYEKKVLLKKVGNSFVKLVSEAAPTSKGLVSISGALVEGVSAEEPLEYVQKKGRGTGHELQLTLSTHAEAIDRYKNFIRGKLLEFRTSLRGSDEV